MKVKLKTSASISGVVDFARNPDPGNSGEFHYKTSTFALLFVAAAIAAPEPKPAMAADEFRTEIRPLLQKYCFDCHGNREQHGDINLEAHTSMTIAALPMWEAALRMLKDREMPPAEEVKLPEADRSILQSWLESTIERMNVVNFDDLPEKWDVARFAERPRIRRLTRREYQYVLEDLIGLPLQKDIRDIMPEDDKGAQGFANSTDGLTTTAQHLEAYLEAARIAVQPLFEPHDPHNRRSAEAYRVQQEAWQRLSIRLPGEGRGLNAGTKPATNAEVAGEPTANDSESARAIATEVISQLATRAFGRPLPDAELEPYLAIFDRTVPSAARSQPSESVETQATSNRHPLADGQHDRFVEGLRQSMLAVLISPRLLIAGVPRDATSGPVEPLDDFELASRMARFLWQSVPDETLLAAADAGELSTDEQIIKQCRRMLADSKADRMHLAFTEQWLKLQELGGAAFPTQREGGKLFGDTYKSGRQDIKRARADELREEVARFHRAVYDRKLPLTSLVDADFGFASQFTLTAYSGSVTPASAKAAQETPGFRGHVHERRLTAEVKFNDRQRGGVLSSAAWLIATSHPDRNNPFRRGKFIYEELLGRRLSPPPAVVPPIPKANKQKKETLITLRERAEQHRSNPACAGCHARFDHFGLALENYSHTSMWRTEELLGEIHPVKVPIDPRIPLPDGTAITGPVGLKEILVTRYRDDLLKTYTRKMVGFAIGRSLTRYDEVLADRAATRLPASDAPGRTLIETIVTSPNFRYAFQYNPN